MTRNAYCSILRRMESIRMDMGETASSATYNRLNAEYGRLWRLIAPYAEGRLDFAGEERQGALDLSQPKATP